MSEGYMLGLHRTAWPCNPACEAECGSRSSCLHSGLRLLDGHRGRESQAYKLDGGHELPQHNLQVSRWKKNCSISCFLDWRCRRDSRCRSAMFVVLDLVVMFGCRLDVFWGGMVNSGSSRFGKAALLTCAVYSLLSHI